jgi:NTP pyrophosphatase (non-canonical NTP hydrolase)
VGTLDEYQAEAVRTLGSGPGSARTTLGLGITGEAGEVADLIKKETGHGHPAQADLILDELGDVLWYVAALAQSYGFTLSDVAAQNVAKLRRRYPDGFSTDRSLNR